MDTRGPAAFNPQAEVDEFRAMVARKPAGILVSVANSNLMAPEIDAAIAAGIPVITIGSDSPESKRLYFIGTNNFEVGKLGEAPGVATEWERKYGVLHQSGSAVAEALKRRNATDRVLIAMDVDTDTLQLVGDGTIDSTIAQKPYTMASLGLKALDEIHHYPVKPMGGDYLLDPNSPFPAFVDTGVALIDKTNLDPLLRNRRANQ